MGRQAFITRLALGRSAYEPANPTPPQGIATRAPEDVDPQSTNPTSDNKGEEREGTAESSSNDSLVVECSDHEQQYDKKGYPQNISSRALKKRWRHAVNDVLATVGVCVAKGRESMPSYGAYESARIREVRLENNYGICISAADALLRFGNEYWPLALRQRLQTFRFYSGIPLVEIIKSEWKHFGRLQFLFGGVTSSLTFLVLDGSFRVVTKYAFDALKRATNGILTPGGQGERLKDTALDCAETLTRLSFFALIAPLEIFSTLQRLDLISPWPLIPHAGTYMSSFSYISTSERRFGFLRPFLFSSLIYVWFRRDGRIELKFADYIWAALPKPTRPDRISLIAAKIDDYDITSIAGLTDENNPYDGWAGITVIDQLAYDLRSLGRQWYLFYDRCTGALNFWNSLKPSDLWSPTRMERVRPDQGVMERPTQDDTDGIQRAPPPTPAIDLESSTRPSLHDPPNHFSPPSSPSTSPSHLSNRGPSSSSNTSSPLPSLPASPRPIELTSHNDNGEVHVNLTIPAPSDIAWNTTVAEGGARARSATVWLDAADNRDEDVAWPDMARQPNSDMRPSLPLLDEEATNRILEPAEAFAMPRLKRGPHHRVTALSAHPAESMAQRMSSFLMDTLCLPLEAFFVRSVATAFLSSSIQSSVSEAAALRWKGDIYPPWPWYGPGWRAGGLKGIGVYVGRLLLLEGLQAAVWFVSWQAGMGVVWWIGRKWCAWRKPRSTDSTRQLQ